MLLTHVIFRLESKTTGAEFCRTECANFAVVIARRFAALALCILSFCVLECIIYILGGERARPDSQKEVFNLQRQLFSPLVIPDVNFSVRVQIRRKL